MANSHQPQLKAVNNSKVEETQTTVTVCSTRDKAYVKSSRALYLMKTAVCTRFGVRCVAGLAE